MMKKTIIWFGILFLAFQAQIILAQNRPDDAKRTPEEQAAFEKGVPVNPARVVITPEPDGRFDPLTVQAPETNWKATTAVIDREISPEVSSVSATTSATTSDAPATVKSQPEPAKALQPVSRRNMQGPKTQPEAKNPNPVMNRGNMNGPATQPLPGKSE
jgi:hypothetical protein